MKTTYHLTDGTRAIVQQLDENRWQVDLITPVNELRATYSARQMDNVLAYYMERAEAVDFHQSDNEQ